MKTAIGCVAVVALVVGIGVFYGLGLYNGLVGAEQEVDKAWANVEAAYQRRADLIPNLVATVKGASEFEQETLNQVIEARAKATGTSIAATT